MTPRTFSTVKHDEAFLPYNAWEKLALDRYGKLELVRFKCPKCGHISSAKDYTEDIIGPKLISPVGVICLGYFTGVDKRFAGGPCRYNSFKDLNENPILIAIADQCFVRVFDFADDPLGSAKQCLEASHP